MSIVAGPLLQGVFDAQQREDQELGYPLVKIHIDALVSVVRRAHPDLVWPVSPGAQRLVGGAQIASPDELGEVRGWTSDVRGRHVLLVATVGTSGLEMLSALATAKRLGAAHISGCAIDEELAVDGLSAFYALGASASTTQ